MKISHLIRDPKLVHLNLEASSKDDLLSQTIRWMITVHGLGELKDEIVQSILRRETLKSTLFSHGLWMPHARVDSLYRIFGVVGLCREGIPLDKDKKELLHFIFMIIYPNNDELRHLRLMSNMMTLIQDHRFRAQWLACQQAQHWMSMLLETER